MVQIGTEADWQRIWAGRDGYIARKTNGSWWASSAVHWMDNFGAEKRSGPTRELNQFADDFNPWAIATSGQTTLVLAHDGRLWSVGFRLGSQHRFSLIREPLAWVGGLLDKNRSGMPSPMLDESPHLIWEMDKWESTTP